MYDATFRKITSNKVAEPTPRHTVPLTPPPKRMEPMTSHLGSKGIDAIDVTRNGIVVHMSLHNRTKPFPYTGDWVMKLGSEKLLRLFELGTQPFGHSLSLDGKALQRIGRCTDVGKAKKVKRLGLTQAPSFPVFNSKSSELDEPRLLGVESKANYLHPLSKFPQESLCLPLILETKDHIISISNLSP